jgi:hypothetical protein
MLTMQVDYDYRVHISDTGDRHRKGHQATSRSAPET